VRMWLVHAMRRARVASDRPAPSLTHRGRAMQENDATPAEGIAARSCRKTEEQRVIA